MFKFVTFPVLLFFSFQNTLATKIDSARKSNPVKIKEIQSQRMEMEEIYNQYEKIGLGTLTDEYNEFLNAVENYSIEGSSSDLEQIEEFISKFKFYHTLKLEEAINAERISTEYFNLSAKVFQYKSRVQNLFTSEQGSGSFYGGMENETRSIILKKRIYETGMLVYDTNMLSVKNTNPCDPLTRITYLNDNLKMLVKMEKLLMTDGTRDLEKSLKNVEDIEQIKELIYGFQID